jgi:uncharacterized protein YjbJ (UPF0337 family)
MKGIGMNSDKVKGSFKETAGKAQQKTGEMIGSKEQQAKGIQKQAAGKADKAIGNVKDALKK